MVAPVNLHVPDPADYAQRLTRHMSALAPTATRPQSKPSFVHRSLDTSSHVFVRDDTVRKPLQPPYKGPFKVLRRSPKYYVLSQNDKAVSVSIDRLKPAFLDDPCEAPANVKRPVSATHADDTRRASLRPPASVPLFPSRSVDAAPKHSASVPARVTRSGRHVHRPKRFIQAVGWGWFTIYRSHTLCVFRCTHSLVRSLYYV